MSASEQAILAPHRRSGRPSVNNAFYDELGERWYDDDTHAIALLRAESKLKLIYVQDVLKRHGIQPPARILDVACGAGFVSIPLAKDGYRVKGIDLSAGSLATASRRAKDLDGIEFACEDALHLTSQKGEFDAVLMLDFLEHVTNPEGAIREAARVLRPGGVVIVHTFNRTLLARLLAIKAIELFTRECPDHVHVYDMFIRPLELKQMLARAGFVLEELRGMRPDFLSSAFAWSALRRRLHPDFAFTFSRSLAVGYIGAATKLAVAQP